MGIVTKIEWADSTVNPSENCDGCELWNAKAGVRKCYAGKMVERWKGVGTFDLPVVLKPGRMAQTVKWPDLTNTDRPDKPWMNGLPRVIFVGDMADIFSQGVPFSFLSQEVISTAYSAPRHLYLMLTKQAKRMEEFVAWYLAGAFHGWPENLWLGVSVTSQATTSRLASLTNIRQRIRSRSATSPKFFVSYGPALERVNFVGYGSSMDWMVIEGESGSSQPAILETETVRETIEWCRNNEIAPFVKQMGSAWAKKYGFSHFKGGDPKSWPDDIHVREMPMLKNQYT